MARAQLDAVLHHVRKLVAGRGAGAPTDRLLLERFAAGREEAAFAALVERHGPMVYGAAIKPVKGKRRDFQIFSRRAGWPPPWTPPPPRPSKMPDGLN